MILKPTHNAGFFSCCSVACYDIIQHIKQHKCVPEVDFSKIFRMHKDSLDQDVYDMYFKFNESQELNIDKISKIFYRRRSLFNYRDEDLTNIQPIINKWFAPSNQVLNYVDIFTRQYKIIPQETLAICFRGTDKNKDIKETPYKTFTSQVRNIIDKSNISRVFIQTDQTQFIDFFYSSYPDIPFFYIKEIPTTTTRRHLYRGIIKENKVIHSQMFLASMQILAQCNFLINHTGNVARWIIKYRQSTDRTIQYKSDILL